MIKTQHKFEFRHIVCPVCGRDDSATIGYRGGSAHQNREGERTRVVRCRWCTHQYPDPMPFPTEELDEIYVDPDEYFQRHDLEKKKEAGLNLMDEFERRLGSKGTFLDVGCGRGELIWAAGERGWKYDGVDPSSQFVEFGKAHLGVEGRIGTLASAGFPSESFDAISMGGVIEHLYDPAEVLQEVYRVLRPNGWLFFDAPNEDGLYMRLGNAYMRLQRRDWVVVLAPTFSPFHVQGFNPRSIREIIQKVGFDMKELGVVGEISPQLGDQTFRKKFEFLVGRMVNAVGNWTGNGIYMNIWAQKGQSGRRR